MPALIQGIDGNALINALRAGREDRYNDDKRNREVGREQQVRGLVGQLFGAQEQPQGVAQQFGVPSQPASFDQAFNPETMAALGRGEDPAPIAQPAAVSPPQRASTPPKRQINRDVLQQLVLLDPETGGRIAAALKQMNDDDLNRAEARNSHMGATAHWLRQFPAAERPQRFQMALPALVEAGFTEEQLANAGQDLSDEALGYFEANAIDYDALMDNERAEREAGSREEDREADNDRLEGEAADRAADRAARRNETGRHNRASEANTRRGQDRPRSGGGGRSGGSGARPRSWGADWRTATGQGGKRIAYNPQTRKWVDEAGKPVG